MKLLSIPAFLLCLTSSMPQASATVLAFGMSDQKVTFTGLGGNASGQGQSRVTWGSCAFDGTLTKCTVSGRFTGIGAGGTYSFVLTYQGDGPSPLTAISSVPGGNLIFLQLSSGSLAFTFTPDNGPAVRFYDVNFHFDFTSTVCTGVSDCHVGPEGLTVGSTISGPISGTFEATPIIRGNSGVISASEYGAFPAIAPGTWIEIYGTNLATTLSRVWAGADFDGNQAPTTLGGTTVTVGGKLAFTQFVSPGQVNAQVPSGVAVGPQPVVVTTIGGASAPTVVTVNAVEPGLLAPAVFNLKAGQYAVATFPDARTFVLAPGITNAVPTARAKPGDTIILHGVGFGPVTPDSPAGQIVQQADAVQSAFKVFFAGVPATVNYAGLVYGFVGLYQFNVVVPDVAASDAVPLTFTLGETKGPQTLLVAVQ